MDILLKEQRDEDSINVANRLIMNFMNNKILDPQTASITKTLGVIFFCFNTFLDSTENQFHNVFLLA